LKDGEHSGVLPYRRNVMDAEDSIEDKDKKVDRTLRKMLQDPVQDTVRARCLAEFKTESTTPASRRPSQ
jgi:muramoyltetrapeptide carboxypeptidase LdcA involved in peptidoglycan recycling